jgi:hypothetical protein
MSRLSRAWLGRVFVLVIALLLAWNVYVARRNQSLFGPEATPRVRPRNIATVAAIDSMDTVAYTFATYYRLRALAGRTLVLPEWLAGHRFHFERVSRLRIELVPGRLTLPTEVADRLRPDVERWWSLDRESPLAVILNDRPNDPPNTGPSGPGGGRGGMVDRYVLVERTGGGLYLLLPEELYRRLLAQGAQGSQGSQGTQGPQR